MTETRREQHRERMLTDNPMFSEVSRQKMLESVRARRHTPVVRGGCGHVAPCQELLANAIFENLKMAPVLEHPVKTASIAWDREGRLSRSYKIDIAFPGIKLGIEVDGTKHRAFSQRELDEKKDRALSMAGWVVLRFKNEEVLRDLGQVIAVIGKNIRHLSPS